MLKLTKLENTSVSLSKQTDEETFTAVSPAIVLKPVAYEASAIEATASAIEASAYEASAIR